MSAAIFISYRRSDAAGHAGRLFDRLSHWYDRDALFYDLDSIDAGDTFPQRLVDGIDGAKLVLVLIGPGWADELNARAAKPGVDYVRAEVEHALRRHAAPGGPKVIPVLLGGVAAPGADRLDASLRSAIAPLLALDLHSFQGKNDDWNHQFVRLRDLLEAVPGVPAARFRVPAGAHPPPFHDIGQSLSRHFSDPMQRLAELQRALEASGSAAVVSPAAIYGMGGVGKTQLALKYSHAYRERYAGVWWLRAETENTLQLDALDACRVVGAAVAEWDAPALAFKRWLDSVPAGAPAWLIVFDNAEDPASLRPFLPERGGHHVLITSRNPAWGGLATPVATGVWNADQGADFLARRLAHHADAANREALRGLSDALGGLPLALDQAAGFIDDTGMAVAAYTAQVHQHDAALLLLDKGRAATGYERSVLATLSIAFPGLDEAAAQLLRLLAFCAPEPVPESLFTDRPAELPLALGEAIRQPLGWDRLVILPLRRYGLADRVQIARLDRVPGVHDLATEPALHLHRLTQNAARLGLAPEGRCETDTVLRLLYLALPEQFWQYENWPRFVGMAVHVHHTTTVALERGKNDGVELRLLVERAAKYMQHRPHPLSDGVTLIKRTRSQLLDPEYSEAFGAIPHMLSSEATLGEPLDPPDWQAAPARREFDMPRTQPTEELGNDRPTTGADK